MSGCEWAILFGVDYYLLFYVNRVELHGEIYAHVHCSPRLAAFHDGQRNEPNIFQALIAILLGSDPQAFGKTNFSTSLTVPVGARYLRNKDVGSQETRTRTRNKSSIRGRAKRAPGASNTQAQGDVGSEVHFDMCTLDVGFATPLPQLLYQF